jgi:DNA-binding MarR family transcriptional regulator
MARAGRGGGTTEVPGAVDSTRTEPLVAPRVMTLGTLIKRNATTAYRCELGLAHNEWRVVSIIGLEGPMSNNALAERLGLDVGQLSREVTGLVKRELLVRHRVGRITRIEFGPKAPAVFARLMVIARERDRVLLDGIPEAGRAELLALLDSLIGRAVGMLRAQQDRD